MTGHRRGRIRIGPRRCPRPRKGVFMSSGAGSAFRSHFLVPESQMRKDISVSPGGGTRQEGNLEQGGVETFTEFGGKN